MAKVENSGVGRLSRRQAIACVAGAGLGIIATLKQVGLAQSPPENPKSPWGPPSFPGVPPKPPRVGKTISIDGNTIYYEETGPANGIPIVINEGSQFPLDTGRPLADKLAARGYRTILWDRANLGRSDVVIKGARDLDLWADQMSELLPRLKASPAYFMGGSSGSRTSYIFALRYPDHVRGLFLFLVTGGGTIAESLGQRYYGVYAELADNEGMEGIIKTPFWAERIRENPANRQRLLAMDPRQFSQTMRRWQRAYRSSDPVIGVTQDELRQLNANGTPIRLLAGCDWDSAHRLDRSGLVASLLPNAEFINPPEVCQEWKIENPAGHVYSSPSVIPALVDEFIKKTEAKPKPKR